MTDEANSPIHPKGEEGNSTPPENPAKTGSAVTRTRRELGGDAKRVEVIVPEGADPLTYIPKTYVGHPIAPNGFCRAWNVKREKYCKRPAGDQTDHPGIGRCYHHHGRPVKSGVSIRYSDLQHRTLGDLFEKFANDPDPTNLLPDLALARSMLQDGIQRHQEFTEQLDDWHASYRFKKLPISPEDADSFRRVVDEWAINILDDGADPTDLQIQDAARAKRYIAALERPVDQGRPRKPVDMLEFVRVIDTIGRLVDRLDKRNVISEPELNRILVGMKMVVEFIVTDPEQQRQIREGWMRVVTR